MYFNINTYSNSNIGSMTMVVHKCYSVAFGGNRWDEETDIAMRISRSFPKELLYSYFNKFFGIYVYILYYIINKYVY